MHSQLYRDKVPHPSEVVLSVGLLMSPSLLLLPDNSDSVSFWPSGLVEERAQGLRDTTVRKYLIFFAEPDLLIEIEH